MYRNVKAELIKIFKSKEIYILMIIYTILFVLVFFQYTINTKSNVIEEKLKNPTNLYSLFLFLFSSFFNIIFCIVMGVSVVSKEYVNNTIQSHIHFVGRFKGILAKTIALAITVCLFTGYIIMVGIALGLYHSIHIDMNCILGRFLICFISTFLLSVFVMMIATLTKSVSKTSILCSIIFFGQMFLPSVIVKYISYLSAYHYVSPKAIKYFNNISGLDSVKLLSTSLSSNFEIAGSCIIYMLVCVIIQMIILRRREFN